MHDLAIVVVSTNEGRWLRPCLSSIFDHAGSIELEVVVADNESSDDTQAVVGEELGLGQFSEGAIHLKTVDLSP